MLLTTIQGIAGLALLYFGGAMLVRGASGMALRFGLSPLAVGLTVVAFGTSTPELLVSVDAAVSGANDISVGNVVGSNIANIALILGVAAAIRPMMVESKVIGVDLPVMVLATLSMLIMMWAGVITRLEGLILVAGLVLYVWLTIRQARAESSPPDISADAVPAARTSGPGKLIALVMGGLALLSGGAHLLVVSAVALATAMNVSQAAIGLTVVAVGTSLPEFATTVVAGIKNEGDIAIGNVIGSNTFNILGVLGLTAIVRPLEWGDINWLDLGLMSGLAVVLGALLLHRLFINRTHGVILLVIFISYTAWRLL